MISNSVQIDRDKLNSFELTQCSRKSCPMLSSGRKQMIFRIKFGAIEETKTYLKGTNLPDFPNQPLFIQFSALQLQQYVPDVAWEQIYVNKILW